MRLNRTDPFVSVAVAPRWSVRAVARGVALARIPVGPSGGRLGTRAAPRGVVGWC